MTDYFVLLNFPRTPWLDPAEVQARFLELSQAEHPDRVHNLGAQETANANAKFADLNKAAAILRDHKERLHHLLALETGVAPMAAQNISSEFIEVFSRVAKMCKNVDQFLAERAKAASPMLQAQLFAKGLDLSDAVGELQRSIGDLKTIAEKELREIAAGWPETKRLERLASLAHAFAMIAKWEGQLQERFAALASI